jgi:hypothetical protein
MFDAIHFIGVPSDFMRTQRLTFHIQARWITIDVPKLYWFVILRVGQGWLDSTHSARDLPTRRRRSDMSGHATGGASSQAVTAKVLPCQWLW